MRLSRFDARARYSSLGPRCESNGIHFDASFTRVRISLCVLNREMRGAVNFSRGGNGQIRRV